MEESELGFHPAILTVLSKLPLIDSLKDEQRTALKESIGGKDVMALLPTGYGKSLIYQMAPLVAKETGRVRDPIVMVVSRIVNPSSSRRSLKDISLFFSF